MTFDPNQKGMHPADKRNLIIFILVSMVIWFGFEHYVITPRVEAAKKQQAVVESTAAQTSVAGESLSADAPVPREEKLAAVKRVSLSSPELEGSLPLVGNRIDDIVLKNYFVDMENAEKVVLMSPAGTAHAHYAEYGWLADDATVKVPGAETVWTIRGNDKLSPTSPVTMIWDNGEGLIFERTIAIDDHFMLTLTQKVANNSGKAVSLYPYSALTRRGLPEEHGRGMGYEGPVGYVADELHEIGYHDLEKDGNKKLTALSGWIGFGEKYWLSAILPSQQHQNTFSFQSIPNKDDATKSVYQVDVRGEKQDVAPGSSVEQSVHVFIGAKKISLLDDYQDSLGVKHFDMAIDFGSLYFLTKPLYFMLIFFNKLVGNFGVAIILLTFLVRGAVFPLANKSYRSFAGLRKISPKMAELKERYGNDKARMHEELVKLYETEKVNPMAGCFPILLQMPIFFAIYRVMSIAVEMRHAPFFGWIHDLSAQDPLTVFNLFGLLPFHVPSFLMIGPWSLVMLAVMLVQKQLNPPPQDQIQRDMANFMPWIITYTLSKFASGLVIYWAVSNLLSVIQQAVIMRSMGVPIYLFSPDEAKEHAESHGKKAQEVVMKIREEKKAASEASIDAKDKENKE